MKSQDSPLYFDIQIPDGNLREELINGIAEFRMDVFPELEIKLILDSPSKNFNNRLYDLRRSEEQFDIEIGTLNLTAYISSYQTGKFNIEEMYHKRIYLRLTPVFEEEELQLELIPF